MIVQEGAPMSEGDAARRGNDASEPERGSDDTPDDAGIRLSSLSPEERHAWRLRHLRRDGKHFEGQFFSRNPTFPPAIPDPTPRPAPRWFLTALVSIACAAATVAAHTEDFARTAWALKLVPSAVRQGRALGLVTHGLVQATFNQLACILVFLVPFGIVLETHKSRWWLMATLIASSVTSGIVHAFVTEDPTLALVGAAGAVSGVVAAGAVIILTMKPPHPRGVVYTVNWIGAFVMTQFALRGETPDDFAPLSLLGYVAGAITGVLVAVVSTGRQSPSATER